MTFHFRCAVVAQPPGLYFHSKKDVRVGHWFQISSRGRVGSGEDTESLASSALCNSAVLLTIAQMTNTRGFPEQVWRVASDLGFLGPYCSSTSAAPPCIIPLGTHCKGSEPADFCFPFFEIVVDTIVISWVLNSAHLQNQPRGEAEKSALIWTQLLPGWAMTAARELPQLDTGKQILRWSRIVSQ